MGIRLIATDLDGTLLTSDRTVSARNRRALEAAQAAGIVVIPATGRPIVDGPQMLPRSLARLIVCSNGAVVYDDIAGAVLRERPIAPEAIADFVPAFAAAVPGVRFATITDAGRSFLAGPGYLDLMRPGDHGRDGTREGEAPLERLYRDPAAKLIARHPELGAEDLLAAARSLDHPAVAATISGVPFLEIAAAGVSKESTLAMLADEHGITPEETMAFGDSINDVGMLAWAGHGVAMGNAWDEAKAVAREITADHDEDGVAVVVERLLSDAARVVVPQP